MENLNVKIGDTVKIIAMYNPDQGTYETDYAGRVGTVTHIDDAGQIHGTFGGCAIIPECDSFVVLKRA